MQKLNTRKHMRTISGNAVQGRLSENNLTRKLSHEIFWTRNIYDLRYTTFITGALFHAFRSNKTGIYNGHHECSP